MTEVGTARNDFGRAAVRIETLEYEWTCWSTGWDTQEEPLAAPSQPGAFTVGLAIQPQVPMQHQPEGPEEFSLTPCLTPRPREDGQALDPLHRWWGNQLPPGTAQGAWISGGPGTARGTS